VSPTPPQFKSFARPDLIKTIHPKHLTSLLEPHRRFLEDRGFSLPAGAEQELDCLALAGILAQPDKTTPSDLVDALYVIESFGNDQHFDELLAMAEAAGLERSARKRPRSIWPSACTSTTPTSSSEN
jgi:hypothetical protein